MMFRRSVSGQNDEGWLGWAHRNHHSLEDAQTLDALVDRYGDARVVMLGEATHGTSEFYEWRHRISQRLIEDKGFSFICVEGDWPDCYAINRYVKNFQSAGASAHNVLYDFKRWPTWMWANHEILGLVDWLRARNDDFPADQRTGFYGLDVYSLWDSLEAVHHYLEHHAPQSTGAAQRAFECFEPYGQDIQAYARATALVPTTCEQEVVELLSEVRRSRDVAQDGNESHFDAEQNALTARNAEHYYRTMVRGGAQSWNIRDHHMMETLERLLAFHGPGAKAIVWAHNTHVGDARATDMARSSMVNIGQLARERFAPEEVALVGFGTDRGTVIAGDEWGAPMRRMTLPKAQPGSFEDEFGSLPPALFFVEEAREKAELLAPRGHRAVGVVYRPQWESRHQYVPTVLPLRYDAFLNIPVTAALSPLHLPPHRDHELPETYPFGE